MPLARGALHVQLQPCPDGARELALQGVEDPKRLHGLDGSGPVQVAPPSLDAWPKLAYAPQNARRVNLDNMIPSAKLK